MPNTQPTQATIRSASVVAAAAAAMEAGAILHFADRDDASVQRTAGLCRRTGQMMIVTYRSDAGAESRYDSAHDLARSIVRYSGKHPVAAAAERAGFAVKPWTPEPLESVTRYDLPRRGMGACARGAA